MRRGGNQAAGDGDHGTLDDDRTVELDRVATTLIGAVPGDATELQVRAWRGDQDADLGTADPCGSGRANIVCATIAAG